MMDDVATRPGLPQDRSWLRRVISTLDAHPAIWLLLGGLLLVASQLRFGIGMVAFVAPVPLLRYLRITRGWRSRLGFMAVMLAACMLALLKIVTEPIPVLGIELFGPPLALLLGLPYLLWSAIRQRVGEVAAVIGFGALMVTSEWLTHMALPFGTWGAAANTQLDHLALLQLASVTGMHGVSFLVYLVAASLEPLLDAPTRPRIARLLGVVTLVIGVAALGEARLALASGEDTETVRVAAVGTDNTVAGPPLPSAEEMAAVEAGLLERTRKAARAGAAMVVWPEVATLVQPGDEDAFLARVGTVAREERVTVVAGYIIPLSVDPLFYENKYALLTPEGRLHHVYEKHHPVPGDPEPGGTGPMPVYESAELGRVGGALCYDYDFPQLALSHARLGVDVVALPSSDWRGIDPIHTQMAAVRAIEGGQSIVRSTRFGLSAGIDPWGRTRGWLSHWDDPERILIVSVPRHGVTTVYGTLGDWFPLACIVYAAALILLAVTRRRAARWYAARPWRTRSSPSRPGPSSTPATGSASTREISYIRPV